ncbi:hypothetical protein ACOME3_001840 [Neoechinorhynchus agilis]
MEVLFGVIDPFVVHYYEDTKRFFEHMKIATGKRPGLDFGVQMAKLAHGLLSGRYVSINPRMLRATIARMSSVFSSPGQQDAGEFLMFLLNELYKYYYAYQHSLFARSVSDCVRLSIEERDYSVQEVMYQYRKRDEYILSLPMTQTDTSMSELLSRWASDEDLSGGKIKRRLRISRFPMYMFVVTQRFQLADDWSPVKLQNELSDVDLIDLDSLRARGPQPHEKLMNEDDEGRGGRGANGLSREEELLVVALKPLGFSHNACLKAIKAIHPRLNEAIAIDWLLEHSNDPDLNLPDDVSSKNEDKVSDAHISALIDMGFSLELARYSLLQTSDNLGRAVDWLFSHPEERDRCETKCGEIRQFDEENESGSSTYELVAIIVHLGVSTTCGHYVAYVKRLKQDGRAVWIGYNDEKVFECEGEPVGKDKAYVYVYKQV